MKTNSSFGRKGAFKCCACDRTTREVRGLGNESCCPDCYEIAGYENMLSDDGELSESSIADSKRLWKRVLKKGNEETARQNISPELLALIEAP